MKPPLKGCDAFTGFPLPAGSFHSSRTSHAGPGAGLNRVEKRHLYERLDPVSCYFHSCCLVKCMMPSVRCASQAGLDAQLKHIHPHVYPVPASGKLQ